MSQHQKNEVHSVSGIESAAKHKIGPSPRFIMAMMFMILIISVIVDYTVLIYVGNQLFWIICFVGIIEILIFVLLLSHILIISLKDLRVYNDHFVLPHQGLYALIRSYPRTVRFEDIEIAYIHSGQASMQSLLRIKLNNGNAISLHQGELGIKPDKYNELIKQINTRHKLNAIYFRS
jgi:hypothetical protein